MSSLSPTDGAALPQVARIRHDGRSAQFFVREDPHADGGVRVGVRVE